MRDAFATLDGGDGLGVAALLLGGVRLVVVGCGEESADEGILDSKREAAEEIGLELVESGGQFGLGEWLLLGVRHNVNSFLEGGEAPPANG